MRILLLSLSLALLGAGPGRAEETGVFAELGTAGAAIGAGVQKLAAQDAGLRTRILVLRSGRLSVRVGERRPAGTPIGDVLYVHGFSDRLDNHGPLFDAWAAAGLRVISFDLPSHGEDAGPDDDIDRFSFPDLESLALDVERAEREDAARPLVLAGWSTGGLIAVRMAQDGRLERLDRPVAGLVLFAPGVAVRALVGEFGIVTEKSLTHEADPPHVAGPSPISPMLKPLFAVRLLWNARLSRSAALPAGLPTLVLLGGDREDRYARTDKVREWVLSERARGARIEAVQFTGARHELDNEAGLIGPTVRAAAASFAASVVRSN